MSEDLTDLRGVGSELAANLRDAGFEAPGDVVGADVEDLAAVPLIGESTARALISDSAKGSTRGADPIVDDHIEEIAELATLPVSDRGVIRLSDIGWSTHKEWQNKSGAPYERYRDAWDEARGVAERKLAEQVADNDPRFLLERAFGYTKEQTIEHEGDGLGDVHVSFTDDSE